MNYTEAVNFVHSRRRFSSRAGLERIMRITDFCGNPQRGMRFIHIAGTNGKGSTSVMISNILTAAGYRTGLSTSPYITDFKERFKINNQTITEQEFAEVMDILCPIIRQLDSEGVEVNEFEVVIAASLLWFKRRECEYVVLEVGLGGRFDATNVIDSPECAVITHIDLDHTDWLGDTVEKIANEKCGIIKKDCRVVAYPTQYPSAMRVIAERCRDMGCTLTVPSIPSFKGDLGGNRFEYLGNSYYTPLVGAHQVQNAVTAIETALALGISDRYIVSGIASAKMPARVEVVSTNPPVILDGAHNPDGMGALRCAIYSLTQVKPIAIIGMLKDKDCEAALRQIVPCFERVITVAVPNPRSLSAAELKQIADNLHGNVTAAENTDQALRLALSVQGDRPIVVCGSLYLAGEMRPKLINLTCKTQ